MRRFKLVKLEPHYIDTETLGPTAEGVEFSDGTCALKRLLLIGSIAEIYESIDIIDFALGHSGKTVVEWIDERSKPNNQTLKENMTSILKITKEQLLEKGASVECKAFRKFIKKFGDAVEFEWTLDKQLELLHHRIWRRRFGWLVHVGLLPMWSMVEVDLNRSNLSKADLRGANLGRANLYKTNLYKADLFRANLFGAYLQYANLGGANLNGADLTGANLTGANLTGVIHDQYTILPEGCNLKQPTGQGGQATIDLKQVLKDHKLYVETEGEEGKEADLSGVDLRGADLSKANLYAVGLGNANLSNADLRGANLVGTYLRWANLNGANLKGADLSRAYMSGANLVETDLNGANLSSANLSSANMDGANMDGVTHDQWTVWPDGIKLVD